MASGSVSKVDNTQISRQKVRRSELTRFLGELSDLLAAGCPLARALKILARQAKNSKTSTLISDIESEVLNGASLAEAMAASGNFNSVSVAMVRASEAGGFLRQTLSHMAQYGRQRQELISRLRGAMTYPAVLMSTALASVVFLLAFVVPNFTKVYDDAGMTLPWATRFLMGASGFLVQWWWAILLVIASVVGFLRLMLKNEDFRCGFDSVLLKIPPVGGVLHNWALSEFARSMSMLLSGGIRALDALVLTSGAVGNRAMRAAVAELSQAVGRGESLGKQMAEMDIFPENIAELVTIAEESGRLPDVMDTLSQQAYKRFSDRVDVMVSLVEPAIVIVVAAVVALVVAAMLLPVLLMNTLVH